MTHNHIHNENRKAKFITIILLNLSISTVEMVAGILSQSMALVSDAFHNFGDTASVIISYIAWIISKTPANFKNTFGYKRVEIISAFVNSLFLFIISIFIISESIKKLIKPELINPDIMMVFSLLAFIVNLISAIMLHKETNNLNWKASYLHLLGDSVFSLVVFIGGFFIKKFNYYFIDPLLSIIMAFIIIQQSYKILLKSFKILIQSSPDIDYSEMKKDIEQIKGVKNIHHIHCWMDNDNTKYLQAHIEVEDCMVSESCKIQDEINRVLSKKYSILHSTLQIETDRCNRKDIIND